MACSSWTFGSAASLIFPVSEAVMYRHARLMSLIMWCRLRRGRRCCATPADFFQALPECLEFADHILDVRRQWLERLEVAS